MARKVFLAMCLTVAPAMLGWGDTVQLTGSTTETSTASDQGRVMGITAPPWNSAGKA